MCVLGTWTLRVFRHTRKHGRYGLSYGRCPRNPGLGFRVCKGLGGERGESSGK